MKTTALLAASLLALSATTPLLAEDRGDRINAHLDQRGERIDQHLDQRSERLAANGHAKAARHLDHRGDRIENKLDRRGNQIDRHIDRRHAGDH